MKAIVLKENNALVLEELEKPEPNIGEILIRIHSVGFNPIDYQMRENEFERRYLKSRVLGREFSGTIVKLGASANKYQIGDAVFCSCGSMGSNGAYAEFIAVPEEIVALKPCGLSFSQSAGLASAGLTALQCFRRMPPLADQSIFISGASGAVGRMLISILLAHNFHKLTAIAGSLNSVESLKNLGLKANQIVNYHSENRENELLFENKGQHFDIAVDCVGTEMAELSAAILKIQGIYMDVTNFHSQDSRNALFSKGATVHNISSFSYAECKQYTYFGEALDTISSYVNSGAIGPAEVEIIGSLTAQTVEEAHHRLKHNLSFGKKLIMTIIDGKN